MDSSQPLNAVNPVKKNSSFSFNADSIWNNNNNSNLSTSVSDSALLQNEIKNDISEDDFHEVEHSIEFFDNITYHEEPDTIPDNPVDTITTILHAIEQDRYKNESLSAPIIKELIGSFGKTIYNQSILDSGQISTLILHLRNLIQKLNGFNDRNNGEADKLLLKQSTRDATEHLKQLLRAARNMQKKPYTAVQNSYWPLKMKMLNLFDLQSDPLNAASGRLREILVRTPRSVLTLETQALLNKLDKPEESHARGIVGDSKVYLDDWKNRGGTRVSRRLRCFPRGL